MKRRSRQEWLALVQKFESSNLSQVVFCAQHDLNPKYFSLRRARLLHELKPVSAKGPFVRAQLPVPTNRSAITLRVGAVQLQFDNSLSPTTLIEIVKGLV